MVEMLERIEALGKPVVLGVPGAPIEGDISHAWNWDQQADWAERMYTLLMSRPNIAGVLWYDLTDQWAFLPSGGLLDELSHPKPRLRAHRAAVRRRRADPGGAAAVPPRRRGIRVRLRPSCKVAPCHRAGLAHGSDSRSSRS
jgi:hypothetical protein